MAVSYDAGTNTITVTGYSAATPCTLADIYNADVAGGWGVVTQATLSGTFYAYTLACHLMVGDGSTASWLALRFATAVFDGDFNLDIKASASLSLGIIKSATEYTAWKGGALYWNRKYAADCYFRIYGTLDLYNSVLFDLTNTWGRSASCTVYSGGVVNAIDSIFGSQAWGGGPHFAWTFTLNAGATLNSWGMHFSQNRQIVFAGTVNNYGGLMVADAVYGLAANNSITIRDIEIYRSRYHLWASYRNTVFTVVDCVFDETKLYFFQNASGTYSNGPIIRIKNTLALTVVDTEGVAIDGASVVVTDSNEVAVSGSPFTTDIDGRISTELQYKDYQRQAYGWGVQADVITTFTPHTVTISKSGYKTRAIQYEMDQARDEIEMLESEQLPPTAPSGLTATAASQTAIDLAWVDNSSDETGFRIERSPDGATLWTHIATAAAGATSYSDTGLDCGTEYYYQVCAVNDNGNSDYTDVAHDSTDACTVPQVIIELESPIP